MPGRCSLSSSCSTGVMPCEASVDTSPVRHTFLKFAAPNSWRLWTYDAQVWMPGDAANSACGSQKVGISTDGRAPRNSLESPQRPTVLAKRRMSAWHETDMPKYLGDVRCCVNSGKHVLALSFSGFDPAATLAVHCGNGFDAAFSLY